MLSSASSVSAIVTQTSLQSVSNVSAGATATETFSALLTSNVTATPISSLPIKDYPISITPSIDISVKGQGYLVTNKAADNSGQYLYESSGDFTENSEGYMVDSNGQYLEGWPLTDGQSAGSSSLSSLETINLNSLNGIEATSKISISANLNAAQTVMSGATVYATMDRSDVANSDLNASQIIAPGGVDNIARGDSFTMQSGSTTATYTYGGFSVGRSVATGSGGDSGALSSSRSFTGNILDADTATQQFLPSTSGYDPSALSFTIKSAVSGTVKFTYNTNPDTTQGQFNSLQTLATAISQTPGLSARVVNNQLVVGSTNANNAVTFTNGDASGNTSGAGINWVSELGLSNVSAGSNRFSSLQSLANDVNNRSGFSAYVINPTGDSSLDLSATNPLATLSLSDSGGNKGSLLSVLGLTPTLGGSKFTPQSTGIVGPAYNASNPATNMASGAVAPQHTYSITVYDSQGFAHTLDASFVKTATNTWQVEIYSEPASDAITGASGDIASGTMTFNGNGTVKSVSASLQNVTVNWSDGADPSNIAFNWGTDGETNGMQQLNLSYNLNSLDQNGAPAGKVTSVSVDSKGVVSATFTNGTTQNVYQLPVAEFANPDKLKETADGSYKATNKSGAAELETAGKKSGATIVTLQANQKK